MKLKIIRFRRSTVDGVPSEIDIVVDEDGNKVGEMTDIVWTPDLDSDNFHEIEITLDDGKIVAMMDGVYTHEQVRYMQMGENE